MGRTRGKSRIEDDIVSCSSSEQSEHIRMEEEEGEEDTLNEFILERRSNKETQKPVCPKEQEKRLKKDKTSGIMTKQQKCSLAVFYKIIISVKERAKLEVWDRLRNTVFWSMISPLYYGHVEERDMYRHELDLEVILQYYDKDKRKFVFGDKEMEIKEDDIHRLFGLPNEGQVLEDVDRTLKKDKRKPSAIFDIKVKKETVDRKMVVDRLEMELKKGEKGDSRIIASLILMHLMQSFFFSKSTVAISWDLVSVCEDIESISSYNWPKMILDFLLNGLAKHLKNQPQTLSGCLMLIYYWFMENTKVRRKREDKEDFVPTFVRWSTAELFTQAMLHSNPDRAVELISKGPWDDNKEIDSRDSDDIVQLTFDDWVPNKDKIADVINETLKKVEELVAKGAEKKKLVEESVKLARLSKDLLEINMELTEEKEVMEQKIKEQDMEIKKLNERIMELEVFAEARRQENEADAANLDEIVQKTKKPVQVSSIEKNVKQCKRKATTKAKDDDYEYETPKEVREMATGNKKKKAAPKKQDHPEQKVEETFKKHTWTSLDIEVQNYYKAYLNEVVDWGDTFWNSKEKPVVVLNRDIVELVEEKYMEDSVIKAYIEMLQKKLKIAKKHIAAFMEIDASFHCIKAQEEKEGDFRNHIAVSFTEPLWSLFDHKKVLIPIHHGSYNHYTLLVVDNENKRFVHMNSYQPPQGERTEEERFHKRATYVVKKIRDFIEDVDISAKYFAEDSDLQDIENERYKYVGEQDDGTPEYKACPMTEREKEVKSWVLKNMDAIKSYKLVEDYDCPQQPPFSSDCGPYMLHFMEKLAFGLKPNKDEADGMRKVILKEFMKNKK